MIDCPNTELECTAPAFEAAPSGVQFDCTHAVYPCGGQSSICYTTDERRARLVAEALNDFQASGKLDAFLREHDDVPTHGKSVDPTF